ncbi:MAG: cell division protein PerM [Candidatus Nanopelagicales bacterium]
MKISRPAVPSVRPTLLITGALGALWAAVIGLVIVTIPVYLAQAASSSAAGWDSTLRSGAAAWLVANDVPIRLGSVWYSLLPWGLLVIPVTLLVLAGRWAAHVSHARTRSERAIVIASAAVVYGLLGLLASLISGTDSVSTDATRSAITAVVVSLLGFGWGVLRARIAARRGALSPTRQVIWRAGGLAIIVLIAVSSVLFLIALVIGFPTAIDMQTALDAGPVGGLVLLLLGIGYLPMMLTWAIAYSAGSAVTIGTGAVISPFVPNSVPTELPPFPLLAALPTGSSTAQWFLPVLIVGAGVLVGIWISRRIVLPALKRAGVAAAASGIAACAVLLAALMSNGSVGVERLRDLGPAPLLTAVLVFALLCVGSIPVVLAFGRRPLIEYVIEEPVVVETPAAAPVVIESPMSAQADEPAITPSSVLDQSNTQVIILPRSTESDDE